MLKKIELFESQIQMVMEVTCIGKQFPNMNTHTLEWMQNAENQCREASVQR